MGGLLVSTWLLRDYSTGKIERPLDSSVENYGTISDLSELTNFRVGLTRVFGAFRRVVCTQPLGSRLSVRVSLGIQGEESTRGYHDSSCFFVGGSWVTANDTRTGTVVNTVEAEFLESSHLGSHS